MEAGRVVVGGSNAPLTEAGKAVYRAKPARFCSDKVSLVAPIAISKAGFSALT